MTAAMLWLTVKEVLVSMRSASSSSFLIFNSEIFRSNCGVYRFAMIASIAVNEDPFPQFSD